MQFVRHSTNYKYFILTLKTAPSLGGDNTLSNFILIDCSVNGSSQLLAGCKWDICWGNQELNIEKGAEANGKSKIMEMSVVTIACITVYFDGSGLVITMESQRRFN